MLNNMDVNPPGPALLPSRNIRNCLCPRALNILEFNIENTKQSLTLVGILSLLSAAYGGIHMSSWDFYFATDTERYLWKGEHA